mmetsp:Transcript_69328/g.80910  ORF Transcript_69328/g.80910 Transcript_69328/m.80910 type:complete len:369 (-) Transcript_69328:121-1227(-)
MQRAVSQPLHPQHMATGAAGSSSSPNIVSSQEAVFFPLPITGGIENLIQLTNLESYKIAFKVRSTIRHRYAVRPTVGFLHPKEEVIVKILLDPSNMVVDGVAPDESTRDAFLIDFVEVPVAFEGLTAADVLKKISEGGTTTPVAFLRRRFPCVFTQSGQPLPKNLTMHVSESAATKSSSSSSRNQSMPPVMLLPTSGIDGGQPVTPRGLSTATLTTPRLLQSSGGTPLQTRSGPAGGFAAAASSSTSSIPTPTAGATKAAALPPTHRSTSSLASRKPPQPTATALSSSSTANGGLIVVPPASTRPEDIVGPVCPSRPSFLESFLCFRLPIPVVMGLLLFSFFASLAEDPTSSVILGAMSQLYRNNRES